MKKITIVDSFSTASLHQMYNACMAVVLDKVFDSVDYIAGKGQKTAIEDIHSGYNVSLSKKVFFRDIWVPEGDGRLTFLFRYILAAFHNVRFLITTSKDRILLINNNNPFALIPMGILNLIIRRKLLIIAHGEMEFIRNNEINEQVPLFYRFMRHLLKSGLSLVRGSSFFYFIVLGDKIKENIIGYGLLDKKQLLVLDHPYFFRTGLPGQTKRDGLIHLGTIGAFTKPKGSQSFLKLAGHFAHDSRIKFHVAGSLFDMDPDIRSYPNVIFHSESRKFIERNEYENIISELDYIVLLYPSTMYKLMASGAVFDAVDMNKPVLCLENDYFNYMFEKHGKFGIKCRDIDEMTDIISRIINDGMPYDFNDSLGRIRLYHSAGNIALRLNELLDEYNLFPNE